ncbi:MAG TPA: Tex family protein [Halanaerobiales bacterium]|nr:Tex family protein [Halanaerobiales bacterium]
MGKIAKKISDKLEIKQKSVKSVIDLIEDGNTIPFIARYRKEQTGGLDETQIRDVNEEYEYLTHLFERKEEIKNTLSKKEKLTEEIEEKLEQAETLQEVEDIYRPFKEKRETRATKATDRGLKPLAEYILAGYEKNKLNQKAEEFIDEEKEVENVEDAIQGASDIIADMVSNNNVVRKNLREEMKERSLITSQKDEDIEDEKNKYELYYDYKEKIAKIPDHRVLAIDRGESDEVLKVSIEHDEEKMLEIIKDTILSEEMAVESEILDDTIKDSFKRLIEPSLNRELRNLLTERAQAGAIEIFKDNLRSLLLTPPYKGHKILGIDPGFRTGCKAAAIDEMGNFLEYKTIFPHPPQNQKEKAAQKVKNLLNEYNIDTIAIGNGTASRETEMFVTEMGGDIDFKYIIVNEAGASVYSASEEAIKEFPDLDVSVRGAISIARRLQDPLSELVKIDPRSIGVGQYQHDVNQTELKESLDQVVESVVNQVGVNLNTASASLLQYVSGINSSVADKIVNYRQENGKFKKRKEIKDVYGVGAKTFEQASGFLQFFSKKDPFAYTFIHPESYEEAELILEKLGYQPADILAEDKLKQLREDINDLNKKEVISQSEIGEFTLDDIIKNLKKPGLDPRDELPDPIFKNEVLKFEDLEVGMVLKGTVRNVVDFGAFVDIGVKQDGLIHISELSYKYVDHPLNVISVGDTVRVKIIDIDEKRKRISLSRKL